MDEIKLIRWRESFEAEVENIRIEYDSFFLNGKLDSIYKIDLDESNEWKLQLEDNIPNEMKNILQRIFLSTKPEDSV